MPPTLNTYFFPLKFDKVKRNDIESESAGRVFRICDIVRGKVPHSHIFCDVCRRCGVVKFDRQRRRFVRPRFKLNEPCRRDVVRSRYRKFSDSHNVDDVRTRFGSSHVLDNVPSSRPRGRLVWERYVINAFGIRF